MPNPTSAEISLSEFPTSSYQAWRLAKPLGRLVAANGWLSETAYAADAERYGHGRGRAALNIAVLANEDQIDPLVISARYPESPQPQPVGIARVVTDQLMMYYSQPLDVVDSQPVAAVDYWLDETSERRDPGFHKSVAAQLLSRAFAAQRALDRTRTAQDEPVTRLVGTIEPGQPHQPRGLAGYMQPTFFTTDQPLNIGGGNPFDLAKGGRELLVYTQSFVSVVPDPAFPYI